MRTLRTNFEMNCVNTNYEYDVIVNRGSGHEEP
jgi:hypothetical protein